MFEHIPFNELKNLSMNAIVCLKLVESSQYVYLMRDFILMLI